MTFLYSGITAQMLPMETKLRHGKACTWPVTQQCVVISILKYMYTNRLTSVLSLCTTTSRTFFSLQTFRSCAYLHGRKTM